MGHPALCSLYKLIPSRKLVAKTAAIRRIGIYSGYRYNLGLRRMSTTVNSFSSSVK